MKFKEHASCIVQYDNIFKAERFLELLESECNESWGYLSWQRSTVGSGEVSSMRTSVGCELSPLSVDNIEVDRVKPLVQEWRDLWSKIDPIVWDYRNNFELDLEADEGYRVLKYNGGAEYKAHHDHFRTNERSLSLVAFLNDDYTGGNLTFPRFKVSIKPKAGTVIMFPSNFPYTHIAEPVGVNDNSIKYSLVTWFR